MQRDLKAYFKTSLALTLMFASTAFACTLRAAVGLHKPPYIFEASNTGLEHELFGAAAAAARCSVQWTHAPPARALTMFRQGETDVMLTLREDTTGSAALSDPYIVYTNVAISLAARQARIATIEQLANYHTVAFQNARIALGDRYRLATSNPSQYLEAAQQITQVRMLFSGRTDVIVGDRRILEYLRAEVAREDNAQIRTKDPIIVHDIFPVTEYRAAFVDTAMRDRFNQGLAQIRSNGTYGKIIARYRSPGPLPAPRNHPPAVESPPPIRPAAKISESALP